MVRASVSLVLLFAVAASLAGPAAQPAGESNMIGEPELVMDLGILVLHTSSSVRLPQFPCACNS